MFGVFFIDIIFFVIPLILIVFWGSSLYRYISAKKINKQSPETFSSSEIRTRLILLIVSSILAGTFIAVVLGFISLMFTAVAFM